jgi:hypothetical protein
VRYYSSTASAVDLTGSISNSATAITVSSTTGFPGTTPYTLVLDPDQPTEEIVEVTNVSGLTLTITRAVDGSSAQAHSAGVANVQHMATARDYREPQEHIAASADVHGLSGGSAVVGTNTVQTLKNKTAQAGSAATVGLIVQGAASQTAAYLDVQDSAGTSAVKVNPGQDTLTVAGTAGINNTASSALYNYVAKFTSGATSAVVGIFKRKAGQTADILQVQDESGTVLAKFDKDGKLTAPTVTSTGDVSGATGTFSGAVSTGALTPASVASTGAVSGTTGTFSGAVSAASYGAVAATTGAFSGAVTATNLPAVPAAEAGKRYHRGTANPTPNGTGYATITHGCGFTPTVIQVTSEQAYSTGVDPANITGTTFELRLLNPAGVSPGAATKIMFVCYE